MAICRAASRRLHHLGLSAAHGLSSAWPQRCTGGSPPRHHNKSIFIWTVSYSSSTSASSTTTRQPSRSKPRSFPTEGFELIDRDELVEEETISRARLDFFYPVSIGEVFNDQFQVVSKLGYGSCSTIWLARDLDQHSGAGKLRKLLDSFRVVGPHGTHIVLVHQVAQMSFYDMDLVCFDGNGYDEDTVKTVVSDLLEAVDFLHTEVQAVHTDIHAGNLLLGLEDTSAFKTMENAELSNPVCRKILPDRIIYSSRVMKPDFGPILLSDFGEVRLGQGPHTGDVMPAEYRAPEILLQLPWSYPVDIWSVGLTAWSLLEGQLLFRNHEKGRNLSDEVHFSELIAALGPPPLDLLHRNKTRALEFWDKNGNWSKSVPIPIERTLEAAEMKLEDKTAFLSFIKRALTWDPNQRPNAKELLQDPWLRASA